MTIDDLVFQPGEKPVYLVTFPIGDYSDDGHGKCDDYVIKSNKPLAAIREAHFKAPDVLGFDIGNICSDYGNRELDGAIAQKFKDVGYDFSSYGDLNDDGNPTWLGTHEAADLWIFALNKIDPDLELERLRLPSMTQDNGGHSDIAHVNVPGYGLFSD